MFMIDADTVIFLGLILAFGAGAISFLSPCVLPIFPAYLSYITGVSVKELQENKSAHVRSRLLSHSAFFLIGVSLIFISLGIGATFLGQWIQKLLVGDSGLLIQRIAGVFIIVMGLFVGGWLKFTSLMKERRVQVRNSKVSYAGSFFLGLGFAAGWTPCIGPIFSSILFLAASNPTQGVLYTFTYVIGFAAPFLLLTFFLGSTRVLTKYSGPIMKIGGVIMVVMGIVLFTGQLPAIAEWLLKAVQGTWFENLG
ncbi:MAG TPA: cytochrome c biogenesis protein CcdA [Bacillota bacterium]|nr:cytochrome c biogenesis protein CcdA [Bacillota bacterium]